MIFPQQESPIKMDANGALNLVSSPSPPDYSQADTSSSNFLSSSPRRSPNSQGGRAGQAFGVEMCVVCGDRASGKLISVTIHSTLINPQWHLSK